ncbi:hypothetical protein [Candidatus Azobacteroides pseudotrichonymphae]|uniref:Uncharacterized protein n=1 Tax=Azobacteroides pseudotrichonymphae genomovar. CFP2 TaxID=511995 RepID=B6YS98_AZOPC|nr:hypothetical protein [Candidatus Azobacteroides pseudotrichonymphae]BAG84070.1 hypothetical protein CFPG_P2-12 [Candidatus Azobacteroides pseudotrichonymphae genomovar. CFP2]
MKFEDFNLRNIYLWIVKLILWLYLFRFAYKIVYYIAELCGLSYDYWDRNLGVCEWDSMHIYRDGSILYALDRNGWATNMALLISACLATFMLHGLNHYCKWDRISKLFKRKSDNKG